MDKAIHKILALLLVSLNLNIVNISKNNKIIKDIE